MLLKTKTHAKWSYGIKTYDGIIKDVLAPGEVPNSEDYSNFRSKVKHPKVHYSYIIETNKNGIVKQYWVDGNIVTDIDDIGYEAKFDKLIEEHVQLKRECAGYKTKLEAIATSYKILRDDVYSLRVYANTVATDIYSLGFMGLCWKSTVRNKINNIVQQIKKMDS